MNKLQVIENCLTFKVNFLCQKLSKSSSFFFIEEYQFRGTFFFAFFFRSINLERMLICQKHLFMKKYQLSCHLMCKLVKKSCMLSNVRIATYKRFSTEKINGKKVFQSHRLPIITELSPKLC